MTATLSAFELEELSQVVADRLDDGLLPALSLANRTGELSELLRLLGMSDLLDGDGTAEFRPTRIAILGKSMASEGKLKAIATKRGLSTKDLEFCLSYSLKHYNFAKFRNTYTYRAVLMGPSDHSTPGKLGASSALAEMQAHPDIYPPTFAIRDANALKITSNSFAHTLDSMLASGC